MVNEVTYLIGRLHLIAHFSDKRSYIKDSLLTTKIVTVRENDWGFFDVQSFLHDNEEYFVGYLVKYKPIDEDEHVDKSTHKLTNTPVNDRVQAKSLFLLHPSSGLIGYHIVVSQIGDNQFRRNFKTLFEAANNNLLIDVEIIPVSDPVEILSEIKSFDIIRSVEFKLHPSNPRFNDRWKNVDEKIRNINAEYFKGVFYNKDGLKIEDDNDILGEILMAVDGYGKARLSGFKNGESHSASTEKEPIKVKSLKEGSLAEKAIPIINKFKGIWDRMSF